MLRKPLSANKEPVPYRFTVTEWHRLGEAGLFNEEDRVELLDGEIIIMSPIGGRHAASCPSMPAPECRSIFPGLGDRLVEILVPLRRPVNFDDILIQIHDPDVAVAVSEIIPPR